MNFLSRHDFSSFLGFFFFMEKRLLSLVQVGLVGFLRMLDFWSQESDTISWNARFFDSRTRFEEHESRRTAKRDADPSFDQQNTDTEWEFENFCWSVYIHGNHMYSQSYGWTYVFIVYRDERNSNRVAFLKFAINAGTRPGHGYFDSETPEDVKIARENHSSSK